MSKDPAVLFYTSDFLTGTVLLNHEQRGKYITLLCLQHQKYVLSEKDMLNICGTYDEDIFAKFIKTNDGFYNERMRTEHDKRKKYSASRSENRSKGLKNKVEKNTITSLSYDEHMENENEDSSYISYLEKNHFSKFEQMKMKLGTIDIKEFLEFFNNKCVIESQPYEFNKLNARFGILFSNWNKDKKEEPKKQTSNNAPDYQSLRGW